MGNDVTVSAGLRQPHVPEPLVSSHINHCSNHDACDTTISMPLTTQTPILEQKLPRPTTSCPDKTNSSITTNSTYSDALDGNTNMNIEGPDDRHCISNRNRGSIRILGLNVCSLKAKLKYNVLEEYIREYDILCLSETKLDEIDNANIILEGFKPFYNHRKEFVHRSGGLAIFVKEDKMPFITELNQYNEGCVQYIMVNDKLLGFNLIIGAVYIPPNGSKYETGEEFDIILDSLVNLNADHEKANICLIGDFNSRTGTSQDFIELDTRTAEETGFPLQENDVFLNIEKLDECNVQIRRYNKDKKCDKNGNKLLDVCKCAGMLIVNGRVGRDKSLGNATCKDTSTVDYAVADVGLFKYISNFEVDTFDPFLSDIHCPIKLEIENQAHTTVATPHEQSNNIQNENTHNTQNKEDINKTCWDNAKKEIFKSAFNIDNISALCRRIDNLTDPTKSEIANITESIKHVYQEAGAESGMIKVLRPAKFKQHKLRRKLPNKPWFTKECENERKQFFKAKHNHSKFNTSATKENQKAKSKSFKRTVNLAYKQFHKELHNKLRNLQSSNPKDYWNILKKADNYKDKVCKITLEIFVDHFKKLNQVQLNGQNAETIDPPESPDNCIPAHNEALNKPFDESDIFKQIKKLKNGKACGFDMILNEFLKNSPTEMVTLLCKYFNTILTTGIIPDDWYIGVIIPIYKNKGDRDDVDNYRGITLLSCVGKLFTCLLNSRLNIYLENNKLLGEEQAGFREGYSTVDHIFTIHTIIDIFLANKKRLYCAFIDYRKAFDTVDRTSLWSKLINLNITGNILTVVKNMYEGAKSCIRHNSQFSDFFACNVGVRQGENLSPLLFSIYLNDLAGFLSDKCDGINLTYEDDNVDIYIHLYTLLYADDTILISQNPEDLQIMLDSLHDYCEKWKLVVNISKTKIIVFSRGKVTRLPEWKFGQENIDVVQDYTYLGIKMNFNGKYRKAMEKQISQAKRALFSLFSKARKLNLPPDIVCHLFDACILPILIYGCEVWGFSNLTQIERVHTFFCKTLLRLNASTANCMALGEVGRFKIETYVNQRILNYWTRLVTGKQDKIAVSIYKYAKAQFDKQNLESKWMAKTRSILNNIGLSYIWHEDTNQIDPVAFKTVINQKICDIESQNWNSDVQDSSHCRNYRLFKTNLRMETYLLKLSPTHAVDLCRFRCQNHRLPITQGRYDGIEKAERKCTLCKQNAIGDEFHYVLECPAFEQDRLKYLKFNKKRNPNVYDFKTIFTKQETRQLTDLAKFVRIIMDKFPAKNTKRKRTKKNKKYSVSQNVFSNPYIAIHAYMPDLHYRS